MAIDLRCDGIDLCAAGPLWLGVDERRAIRPSRSVRIGLTKEVVSAASFLRARQRLCQRAAQTAQLASPRCKNLCRAICAEVRCGSTTRMPVNRAARQLCPQQRKVLSPIGANSLASAESRGAMYW